MKPITMGALRALLEAGLDSGILDTLAMVTVRVVAPTTQARSAMAEPTVREALGLPERAGRKRGKRSGLNAVDSIRQRITEDQPQHINVAYMTKWLIYEGFKGSSAHHVLGTLTRAGFLRKVPGKNPTEPGVWEIAPPPELPLVASAAREET